MAKFKMALDKLAHSYAETIMNVRALEPCGHARIYYHGDGLYGIHNLDEGTITLIYADSIREARDKVLGVPKEDV